ncbi:MAG: adenylyl-sulfate kinase [Candidatus Odinarchaeum yellowstonii]|uniref:Adenylyl-sulfate kinase n=1 Tax=Odinarchaeota yellowstonii (strain LCB_4) TaxID=1841599 RepID=A0AAF0IAT7_ODILC|nr:MAG: adenylyl-sulfate kinase [Candidatus Odinarchaeum yellowstonii]
MAVKPFAVWITGLPGSGKSVVSERLKKLLEDAGVKTEILRMDEMRRVVTPNPKYTDEERQIVYNAISYTAMMLTKNNISVIIDATGNLRRYRELARRIIPNFMEAYIKCPLKIAMKRESERKNTLSAPTGIYEGAKTGKSKSVPGLQAPYEEPVNPEITVESDKLSVEEEANLIFKKIIELFSD